MLVNEMIEAHYGSMSGVADELDALSLRDFCRR
jgi:hypothetical protein